MVLSSISDAVVALGRIGTFLTAEELEEPYLIDQSPTNKYAVRAEGTFTWETVGKVDGNKFGKPKKGGGHGRKGGKDESEKPDKPMKDVSKKTGQEKRWWSRKRKLSKEQSVLPPPATSGTAQPQGESSTEITDPKKADEKPFALTDLRLRVPKGQFIAIVGRVGSGKSSVLQSLIGEMRKTSGEVSFVSFYR